MHSCILDLDALSFRLLTPKTWASLASGQPQESAHPVPAGNVLVAEGGTLHWRQRSRRPDAFGVPTLRLLCPSDVV
jgi:hypothetical protein